MSKTTTFRTKTLADLETLLPGFRKLWPEIKAACGTSCRAPRSVTFTDVARREYLNDDECGRRFKLNLQTMKIEGAVHMSGGDWAVHAGTNNDAAVSGIPTTHALLSCTWNDHHRYFSITVQVTKLPEHLAAVAS
jgi:hypothetical protein